MRNIINSVRNKRSTKNTICVLPWIHLYILPSGKVIHCCATSYYNYNNFAGDLKKQTIEEIWNGDFMRSLRNDMINGVEPKICSRCFEYERISGSSYRLFQNSNFSDKLKEIPVITKSDGRLDKVDLKYWDFRFSNLCNYKCRICSPNYSSAWIPDAKKLGLLSNETSEKPNIIESVDQNTNMYFIKKYINTVEKINFGGGEPLLIEENWQILEMLDENKRYDVNLSYATNLSVLKFKNKNALDYWVKWGRRILLMPSIDDIGKRAELMRSGINWKNFEANLKAVSKIGIGVQPNITVSAMNIFRIPEIIDYLTETGIINHENRHYVDFNINILEYPPILHVSVLPDKVRKDICKRIENFINDYEQKYDVRIRDHFPALFWHLKKTWNKRNCVEFKEFTNTMDKIRGENTLEIIPELDCILNVSWH